MKTIHKPLSVLMLVLVVVVGAIFIRSVQAASYHTITIDGQCNLGTDWNENDEVFRTNVSGNFFHLTWDATNIYVGWEISGGGGADSDRRIAAFDTNPGVDDGVSAPYAGASFGSRGQPDFAIDTTGISGTVSFSTRTGSVWGTAFDPVGSLQAADATGCNNNPFVEVRIPRSLFGGELATTQPVAIYSYLANPSGTSTFSGMPDDAGLCNPSANESNELDCSLYFPDTASGQIPVDYAQVQADLVNKTYTAAINTTFHDVILEGGTLDCPASSTINVKHNFDYSSGTFNLNSCTVNFNGSGSLGGSDVTGVTFNNVTIASASVLTATTNFVVGGNWLNNGSFAASSSNAQFNGTTALSGSGPNTFYDLSIQGGGALSITTGGNINVRHDFMNDGTFLPGASTFTFNGNSLQTIGGSVDPSFNNLGVSNTGGGVDASSPITLNIQRHFAISTGVFTAPLNLNVTGNFTNSGTFNPVSGTVTFNGALTQNLVLNGPTTFNNLSVGNSTTLIEKVAANNATVNGTLLNQGVIRKTKTASSGSNNFGLTGVDVQVATPGTLSPLQIDRIDANAPGAPAPIQTGLYWILTSAGSGFTLNLSLPHTLGSAQATTQACRFTGTDWDCNRTSSTSATITRNAVTQLGTWAVGNNPATDLALNVTSSPNLVGLGGTLVYSLTATHTGLAMATGVILTDTLPISATFNSIDVSQGSCGTLANVITCNIGDVQPGVDVTATIKVQAPALPLTLTNVIDVFATNDTNAANNHSEQEAIVRYMIFLPLVQK
jgi:uncharacterized repeat protein (TIGR01451 family)